MNQLLATSKVAEGEYDGLIKEGIRDLIMKVMQKSRGTENPNIVIERIGKIVEDVTNSK
jgi:hypothetical protein